MKCGHCKAALIAHEGEKAGFYHCNGCGCCFEGDRKTVRGGHEGCRQLPPGIGVQEPPVAKEPTVVVAEVAAIDEQEPTVTTTDVAIETSKGTGKVNGRRMPSEEMGD